MSKIILEMAYGFADVKPDESAFFRLDEPRHTIKWDELPAEAKWAFSDPDGLVRWFSHKPIRSRQDSYWTFRGKDWASGNARCGIASGARIFADWKHSLVRRPK